MVEIGCNTEVCAATSLSFSTGRGVGRIQLWETLSLHSMYPTLILSSSAITHDC